MFVFGTVVVAMFVIAAVTRSQDRCRCRVSCTTNLKQVGLAFRMWANDNGDRFPMQVSIAEGGTKELALKGFALPNFTVLSNELITPKPLHCPSDPDRRHVTQWARFGPVGLGYFVSMDAFETNPASILAGDRNVFIKGKRAKKLARLEKPEVVAWGSGTHVHQGNIVLGDGSAHLLDDLGLRTALTNTTIATNRFVFP